MAFFGRWRNRAFLPFWARQSEVIIGLSLRGSSGLEMVNR
jgi:hypothetical protein